jgi:hypothetical protein
MQIKEFVHERKESLLVAKAHIKDSLKNDERSIEKMQQMVLKANKAKENLVYSTSQIERDQ